MRKLTRKKHNNNNGNRNNNKTETETTTTKTTTATSETETTTTTTSETSSGQFVTTTRSHHAAAVMLKVLSGWSVHIGQQHSACIAYSPLLENILQSPNYIIKRDYIYNNIK